MAESKKKKTLDLSKTEVVQAISKGHADLFSLKMKKATGQLENPASLWMQRKALARLKTKLTQLEKADQKA